MRKAASGGDAALSHRDRRRALHVVPNGYLQKRLAIQTTAADGMVQFDDDRIHQREVFDSGTPRLPPPHRIPPSPHSPRLIVPSPIRTIIGESLRVGELVGKVSHHRPALHGPSTPTPQKVLLAVSALGSGRKPNWVSLDAEGALQGNPRLPQ
jgi:hypothetical protein